MNEKCELYDRLCINCGECELCDLDQNKICDNCCKCIDTGADYAEILIQEVITDPDKAKKFN